MKKIAIVKVQYFDFNEEEGMDEERGYNQRILFDTDEMTADDAADEINSDSYNVLEYYCINEVPYKSGDRYHYNLAN